MYFPTFKLFKHNLSNCTVIYCMENILFNYCHLVGHLGCFQLIFINNATMKLNTKSFFCTVCFFLMLEVILKYINLFQIIVKYYKMSSNRFLSVYMPINNEYVPYKHKMFSCVKHDVFFILYLFGF